MEQPLSMSATKQIGKARIVFPQCMIKTSILNQALVGVDKTGKRPS